MDQQRLLSNISAISETKSLFCGCSRFEGDLSRFLNILTIRKYILTVASDKPLFFKWFSYKSTHTSNEKGVMFLLISLNSSHKIVLITINLKLGIQMVLSQVFDLKGFSAVTYLKFPDTLHNISYQTKKININC